MAIGDVQIGGIDVWEIYDSYGVEVGLNARARRTFVCNWADRIALQSALCGEVVAGVFTEGLPYPDYTYMICNEAPIVRGVGAASYAADEPIYEQVMIDALYAAVPYDIEIYYGRDVFISEDYALGTEFTAVGNSFMTWGAGMGGTPVLQPVGVNVGIHELMYTRWNIPDALYQVLKVTIQGIVGRTNDAAWRNWPKRSLKMEGLTTDYRFTPGGEKLWDVTYLIRYRQQNWDFFPGTGGAWFQLAASPYSEVDFDLLWS